MMYASLDLVHQEATCRTVCSGLEMVFVSTAYDVRTSTLGAP